MQLPCKQQNGEHYLGGAPNDVRDPASDGTRLISGQGQKLCAWSVTKTNNQYFLYQWSGVSTRAQEGRTCIVAVKGLDSLVQKTNHGLMTKASGLPCTQYQ